MLSALPDSLFHPLCFVPGILQEIWSKGFLIYTVIIFLRTDNGLVILLSNN